LFLFFLVTWSTLIALSAAPTPLTSEPHYANIAKLFALQFPREHLTRLPMDDMISSRTWTNYLASLDYDRVYFLASDIARLNMDELNLDDKLKKGYVAFAYEVFDLFKERVRNRCEYVNLLLDRGFDLEKNEFYKWNRKNASWPRDENELNEIWHKKIKNEYLQRVVARALAAEPQEKETKDQKSEARDQSSDLDEKNADLLSPEEFIRKRYSQFLTVLEDSDSEFVLQKYLSAFSHAYDPHSDYMSPSSVDDFDIQMKLSLVGIGALLKSEDGAATVVRIIPGGPADHDKRLKPGDKIIAVAQGDEPPVDVLHWPLYKTVDHIRGKKGTKVVLTIIPASDPTGSTTRQIDLIRDEVKLEEQAAKSKIEQVTGNDGVTRQLGIITLPAFYANVRVRSMNSPGYLSSAHDVENILKEMNEKGVEGILLDLRNNGGGFLPEAVSMTGLFITTGPTVQVMEKYGGKVLYDEDQGISYSGPLVVLVNRLSASASEIVAGALQDYGRAVIVGDSKTHGKGTVQAILEMGRDTKLGSVKITSAIYYRISGGSTQLKGISPDIVVASPFDYMEFGEDFLPNPVEWSKINAVPYSPVVDLSPVISVLRKNSIERRAADPHFAAYTKLIDRFCAVSKIEELSLNLNKRIELAKTEKELYDLQREVSTADEDRPKDDNDAGPDLVLNEALNILFDLAAMRKEEPACASHSTEPTEKTLMDAMLEWLRTIL